VHEGDRVFEERRDWAKSPLFRVHETSSSGGSDPMTILDYKHHDRRLCCESTGALAILICSESDLAEKPLEQHEIDIPGSSAKQRENIESVEVNASRRFWHRASLKSFLEDSSEPFRAVRHNARGITRSPPARIAVTSHR
jgi:hypothetical protein